MFAYDVSGDHMVETYSSTGLVMVVYFTSIVSFYFPHVVEFFEYLYCFACVCCCVVYVFGVYEFQVESQY